MILGSERVEEVWRIRQLLLFNPVTIMEHSSHPRNLLTVMREGRINRDRSLGKTRDLLVKGVRMLIDDADPRGNLNDWIEHALDRSR